MAIKRTSKIRGLFYFIEVCSGETATLVVHARVGKNQYLSEISPFPGK